MKLPNMLHWVCSQAVCCLDLENTYLRVCVYMHGERKRVACLFSAMKYTEFGLLVYTTRLCIWHVIHICMRECVVARFDAVFNLTQVRCFICTTTKFYVEGEIGWEGKKELVSVYLCRVECALCMVHKCVWLLLLFESLFSSYIPNSRLWKRWR